MSILAIDLWDRKVGTALEIEWVSIPRDIIPRVKIIAYIKDVLKNYSVTHIVVGLPYDLYGKDTKQLKKTELFIEKLREIFPHQQIVGYDERFTSFDARRTTQKGNIDDISASLILESYLIENTTT